MEKYWFVFLNNNSSDSVEILFLIMFGDEIPRNQLFRCIKPTPIIGIILDIFSLKINFERSRIFKL